MKALTLWEPWASAMALGIKSNETRGWFTRYRGDIAIHAALRKMTDDDQDTWDIFIEPDNPNLEPQYGKIVCVVELFDCLPAYRVESKISSTELAMGDYSGGRHAWLTRNLRRLISPVQCQGAQGLWDVPKNLLPLIVRP